MNGTENNKVIGVAFGDPLGFNVFSGYSRHLFLAFQQMNALAGLESSRLIRFADFFRGCLNCSPILDAKRPNISAHWLWNPATIHKFSKRLSVRLQAYKEELPILQVGTHVYPVGTDRLFFCITDMTIKQAVSAEQFRIRHLTAPEVAKAIQVQKHMFDTYEKIFVLCEWTRQSVIQDYGQSPQKVVVIGAGANMPPLDPDPCKFDSHEILFVGYDWIRKGGPLLLEVFQLVKKKIPDAVLHIVGCKPSITMDGVNVIGPLRKASQEQMKLLENLYRRANCFCLLPEFDPFPNVLLEAGITSTPVVSLKTGSRSDAVRDGVTGILAENNKASHIAEAVIYILANPDVAGRMGMAARKFIGENYTWGNIVKKLLGQIFNKSGHAPVSLNSQPVAITERT